MGTSWADDIMEHTSLGIITLAEIRVKVGIEKFFTGHTFSATVMEKLGKEMEINKRETNQGM